MPACAPSRLERIEAAQNADGGWGYFPGKESWLEPTVYALLALREQTRARAAFEKGWRLVRSWDAAGGGWRAGARVAEPHWASSLVVTLYGAMGVQDAALARGVEWLVASRGAETRAIARVKTHHWAGATLSMKNLFGVVPGALYGWPKNHLHQVGIARSAAGLYRLFPRSFGIVDGIVGMEGNGPIQGRPCECGVLVMGHDLAAVDATACRVMGIDPDRIEYLQLAAEWGHVGERQIEQRGETISSVRTPFALMPQVQHVRLA